MAIVKCIDCGQPASALTIMFGYGDRCGPCGSKYAIDLTEKEMGKEVAGTLRDFSKRIDIATGGDN